MMNKVKKYFHRLYTKYMLKEANISKTEYFKKVNITFQNK